MGVPAPDAGARQNAPVGQVLRGAVVLERQRSVAWLVAGSVALAACAVLDAPDHVTFVVVLTCGLAFLWVLRRLWAAWLALRDFTNAATPPRRAFVVLLHDPAPRMIRPLLGVWSDEPVQRDGRLPKPEHVYRCDEELDALECHQGSVVVHEAWVDTRPRQWAKPRWGRRRRRHCSATQTSPPPRSRVHVQPDLRAAPRTAAAADTAATPLRQ